MFDGELDRQRRLKAELARDPQAAGWLDEAHLLQSYKQLQFFDLLALYFNRVHPSERGEQTFGHVPMSVRQDASITIRPRAAGTYELSPYPFAAQSAEFAYAGRHIRPGQQRDGGWSSVLREAPTRWEAFRLVAP
jgi:hypothetical protein